MNINKTRVAFVMTTLILFTLVIVGRLFYIQIVHGDEYAIKCQKQAKYRTVLNAQRGTIKDRNGNVLAKSVSRSLDFDKDLKSPKDNERKTESQKKVSTRRIYPYGELAGQVLGYTGKDGNGLSGVEFFFDRYLHGEDGWGIVKNYGRNSHYSRLGLPKKTAKNGCDITLTLDVRIQTIVEKVLGETVKKFHAKNGQCIVMDPNSGEILAMANYPSFNPNVWKRYASADRNNCCISSIYEPGSTFKVLTAAIALQEKLFNERDSIDGNQGVYKIYDQVIRDHKPYGKLSFEQALSFSSNVCFSKIAKNIQNDHVYNYTRNFGMGAQTGVNLPGEEIGIVHPVSRWSGRTRVTMAIGQEVSTTLLQMVTLFCSVANGGLLMEPQIFSKITSTHRGLLEKREPVIKRRVISEDVSLRLRRMMKGVVDYGTATRCGLKGIHIGGKTGTSQKIDKETNAYSDDKVWASFIGFAPVENPTLVCGVMIDEPTYGEFGGVVAAPVFRQVIQQIVSHPELEYAEKLIDRNDTSIQGESETGDERGVLLPSVCGMERKRAAKYLTMQKMPFEVIGTGNTIAYQSPEAGSLFNGNTKLILYTVKTEQKEIAKPKVNSNLVRVPHCIGKDLRDAINALNLKGLVPHVEGAGIVRYQEPTVGEMVKEMVPCTLICSFDS